MYDILIKKYTPGWGGVVRIILWAVFFLWIAGFAIPKNLEENIVFKNSVKGKKITSMMLPSTDKRIVREDVAFDPDALNIAWVCDSSCVLTPPGKKIISPAADFYEFIPEEVLTRLSKRVPGRKFHIYFYGQLGSSLSDERALIPIVLAGHPDIIVFSANTTIVNETLALSTADQSKAVLSKIWLTRPETRLLPFVFVSPSLNLYAIFGEHLRSIREMTYFKTALSGTVDDTMEKPYDPVDEDERVSRDPHQQLFRFWLHFSPRKNFTSRGHLIPSLPDPQSYIYTIFEETIGALAASGIPTLIYATPVAPFCREDPDAGYVFAAREKELRLFKEHFKEARDLLIVDHIPDAVARKLIFKPLDIVHLENADALVAYLTEEVAKMVEMHNSKKGVKHEGLRH